MLIADDVSLTRDALARQLRERGYDVVAVADGVEAVERAARDAPDAVVMDVNMPRLSGLDAAAKLKQSPSRHLPVILLSARNDVDSRVAALAVADDFLAKPYDHAELVARLEAHLRTRRLVEELRAGRPPESASGMRTRAALLERLAEEWARAVRFNEPLSLLIVGPDAAEPPAEAIAAVGEAMQRVLRQIDVTARYQGADVCALLPNTHVAGALVAAGRLKRELLKIVINGSPLSVSMGIAFYPSRDIAEQADLVRTAERAIARARDEGPGTICLYQHQGYLFQPE